MCDVCVLSAVCSRECEVCVMCVCCSGRAGEGQRRADGGIRVSAADADQAAGRDGAVLQLVRQSQGTDTHTSQTLASCLKHINTFISEKSQNGDKLVIMKKRSQKLRNSL